MNLLEILKTEQEALEWIEKNTSGVNVDYCKFKDGAIDIIVPQNKPLTLNHTVDKLEVQMGTIKVSMVADKSKISSLEGFPRVIKGYLSLENCKNLKSIKGIHKHIQQVDEVIYLGDSPIEGGLLGLIFIKNLQNVYYMSSSKDKDNIKRALRIISKHLGKGRAGILDAQNNLIDAGLDEYAEL